MVEEPFDRALGFFEQFGLEVLRIELARLLRRRFISMDKAMIISFTCGRMMNNVGLGVQKLLFFESDCCGGGGRLGSISPSITYVLDLVLARLVDQQLLIVLDAHQLSNEICQSHGRE